MIDDTKIMLSEPELNKVLDSEWILTKHRITEKVFTLFHQQALLINELFKAAHAIEDEKIASSKPKIYKGENYLGLPYVTLDYPAVFEKDNIFALRTMFWWGNFYSITLHISGAYKKHLHERILKNMSTSAADFFVCVHDNEWQHHFKADNYLPAAKIDVEKIKEKPFLKIALSYDLKHWNIMPQLLHEGYLKMIRLLED